MGKPYISLQKIKDKGVRLDSPLAARLKATNSFRTLRIEKIVKTDIIKDFESDMIKFLNSKIGAELLFEEMNKSK